MREIKFRGKHIVTDGWRYGSHYDDCGEEYILPNMPGSAVDYEDHQVDPNTVGQYTGLKDKNGKEIYEGDIVECVSWYEYFTNTTTGELVEHFRRKMVVDFRKGGFKMVEPMPEPMKDNEWDIIYNGDIEVIGNRYDNPELLMED